MTDVSDIGDLLEKAQKHARRIGWLKTALVALSSLVGTAIGAGWTARGYLGQLATKDDVVKIMNGQQEQIADLQKGQRALGDRVTTNEIVAVNGRDCCSNTTRRVDALYAMPLQVRR